MDSSEYKLYQEISNINEDLQQGDIIIRRPEYDDDICKIIEEYFPTLPHKKYIAYLVITQSCDLARREENENRCKADYINLVGVQRLEDVFLTLVDKICGKYRQKYGYYASSGKDSACELLQRICNQNEWSIGIFFLHDNADFGLSHNSIAMLQESFAIKATEYYDSLLNSRSGRLTPQFQNRLGWLVGNLYSRVATVDFPEDEYKEIREKLFKKNGNKNLPIWLLKRQIKKIKNETGQEISELEKDNLDGLIASFDPISENIHKSSERIVEILKEIVEISQEQEEEIKIRIRNDIKYKSCLGD